MGEEEDEFEDRTAAFESLLEGLNLQEFFCVAIRSRSLYGLLEALSSACLTRADQFRHRLESNPRPGLRPFFEDEMEFFDAASDQIVATRLLLDDQWKDRAPRAAHGDVHRESMRISQIADDRLKGLASNVNDQTVSAEERNLAAIALAKAGRDMIWIDRETGLPDFERVGELAEAADALTNPDLPAEERRKITEMVLALLVPK